jgi:hypothetical protein
MLREDLSQSHDDISTITGTIQASAQNQSPQNNNGTNISGVTRSIEQVTLDSASQAFNCRRINALVSTERLYVNRRENASIQQSFDLLQCQVELDSHADTCGVNHVARVLEAYGQVAQVSGFSDTMTPLKDIPIVKGAIAYDIPKTGEVIILILNQALYLGENLSQS